MALTVSSPRWQGHRVFGQRGGLEVGELTGRGGFGILRIDVCCEIQPGVSRQGDQLGGRGGYIIRSNTTNAPKNTAGNVPQ